MNLTICYVTNRKENHFEWFIDSLVNHDIRNIPGDGNVHVIKINYDAAKPSVWQGSNRLTKTDFFAASNARNTGACLCRDEWIAYVDDLSVLMPGWLNSVREAMAGNYIACGAFRKVKNLVVEKGNVISYEDHPAGHDCRWELGNDNRAVDCNWGQLYGCSVAMPIQALLDINGWPEDLCDGMGYEDCVTGQLLEKAGYKLKYDCRMLTLESEEGHHVNKPMLRIDPGQSPHDKSHKMLEIASKLTRFDNDFGDGHDFKSLRQHVLNGGAFPVRTKPDKEWFTGIPLSEFHEYPRVIRH